MNLHASLLPRWRGAAPIQRSLLAGDLTTGVCLMAMSEGLDEGPVYACAETPIRDDDTSGSLHQRLAAMGADLLLAALASLLDGAAVARPQDGGAVSYAAKITKQESQLDWTCDAAVLERQVRAFNPSPIAWTAGSSETAGPIRIWAAAADVAAAGVATVAPGTVVAEDASGIQVATGHGLLRIQRLQLPGKRPMDVSEFLNGRSLQGQRFLLADSGAS